MPVLTDFVHRFEAGTDPSRPVLVALHGTGGDENDLVPVARMIDRNAAVLSPRGRVLENGMPRFFRRLAEGVFDQEDLRVRTREMCTFLREAADRFAFDASKLVAVGYSNGANIAASVLLSEGVFAGAILLRPMVPFEPSSVPDLGSVKILISASRQDPIVPPPSTERLAQLLTDAGAEVTTAWYPTGHGLTAPEIRNAAEWYRARY